VICRVSLRVAGHDEVPGQWSRLRCEDCHVNSVIPSTPPAVPREARHAHESIRLSDLPESMPLSVAPIAAGSQMTAEDNGGRSHRPMT